jgi:hypothetical protein
VLTTVAGLAAMRSAYISQAQGNFGKVVNNIYSDWYKLSTVGTNVVGSWLVGDATQWSRLQRNDIRASKLYFNLQIGRALYNTNLFITPDNEPWQIGAWLFHPVIKGRAYWTCNAVYPNNPGLKNWVAHPHSSVGPTTDLVYLRGAISNNGSRDMSITGNLPSTTYMNLLTGPVTGDSQNFGLPLDLLLATHGGFSRSSTVPNYGYGVCPNIGAIVFNNPSLQ